jgi:nitrate reductase delta subunit
VFRAIAAIAATQPRKENMDTILLEADPAPDDLAALDAAWEEEAVTFGPGASGLGAQTAVGGCGSEALAARMRHAKRAVPTVDNPLRSGGLA